MTLLGVNIDHIATVRQARREAFPDPVEAALAAIAGGAHGITAHLREDRRHIQDIDIERLKSRLSAPLNLEMALSEEILTIAERVRPAWVCLVPEKREELTTEGGLDVVAMETRLVVATERLHRGGTRVSFFIEPEMATVMASIRCEADAIEFHTGAYARAGRNGASAALELEKIVAAARSAQAHKLIVNAGHGLDYENVGAVAAAFPFNEFNIGFSIVARALFVGMERAVREMKERMTNVCVES